MNKKPILMTVWAGERLKKYAGMKLEKHLRATDEYTEEICPFCNGTGIAEAPVYSYGLEDEDDSKKITWYHHESLGLCNHCFHGVVRRCNFCGKITSKGLGFCDCEGARKFHDDKVAKRNAEKFEKAELMSDEMAQNMELFYSDDYSLDEGYFSSFEEFFEDWSDREFETGHELDRPKYVWGTKKIEPSMNAYNLIENTFEDLEGAFESISDNKINELQGFLNDWLKNCGVNDYYEVSYKYKLEIPWDEYEKDYAVC